MLSEQEFNALHDLYNSTNGDGWVWHQFDSTVPWNFSIPKVNPCADKWQGVGCSCTNIHCDLVYIYLEHHNMTGHLPLTIGSFPSLQTLDVHFNHIGGTIPTTIGNLTMLVKLDLSVNDLVGGIPKQIEYLQNLENLALTENAFNKIPDEFFKLPKLRELSLAANAFSGPISPSFGYFRHLVTLQLEGNYFSQALPDIFSSFSSLETLNIEQNDLTGTLPSSFYDMYNLSSLTIAHTKIASTLSPAFGNFTNLQSLFLSHNRFYGSLPETFGNLTKLRDFELNSNFFTGQLPSSMAAFTDVHLFYLEANSFTGEVSFLTKLTKANTIDLENNFFNGSFIVQSDQLLHLRYLQQSTNSFSGPMPWNMNWTKLGNYEIFDNYFTGVLPHGNTDPSEANEYQDCTNVIYFFANLNYLIGTIPEYYYLACQRVFYFTLADNYLTGTVSTNISSLTTLNEWNVSLNYLTGTIPAEIGVLINVAVMDFSNNQFTGKFPATVQSAQLLEELSVQNNQLSGSLNAFLGGEDKAVKTNFEKLRNINLSGNRFTGTLPVNFFANATSLQSFVATSNCLSGSIPEEICFASFLISLSLDGLSTAENCRVPLFSAVSSLFDGFAVRHFMQGTIPPCLYEMPSLQLLHLSGNGITGTISSNTRIADTLTDLSLSHNLITGTIPMNIQNKYWENLDLSYNKLTGTLSSQFVGVFNPSESQELYLEINRLSGEIPSAFQNITNLAVLNGNIFSCSWNGENLPKHDSDYADYSCGSNNVNYVLFGWVWTLFLFPVVFLTLVRCFAKKSLTLMISKEKDIEKSGGVDGQRSTDLDVAAESTANTGSKCPSSPSMRWLARFTGFPFLTNLYQQAQVWKSELLRQNRNFPETTLNLVRLSLYIAELRRSAFLVTAYCVCILLPLYCVLKKFEASYSVEYAWYAAGVLLSGEMAAVLLFLALFGFLLLIYYLLGGERMSKKINDNVPKSDVGESKLPINDSNKLEIEINEVKKENGLETLAATGVRKATKDSFIVNVNYIIIFILDLVIMGIVDFSYVYIVINYNSTIVTSAAFSLAVFRLITNNLLLWKAIPATISTLTFLMPSWKELPFYQQKYPRNNNNSNTKNVLSYYTYWDISFLDNLNLFNNIIIPVLATMFILPDCFYNALFAAQEVSSYYPYQQCDQYILEANIGRDCHPETQTLSYSPPYIYSYQCSSKVIINYASVYILMFILASFVPLMKLGLKLYYDKVVNHNLPSTTMPTRHQLRVKHYFEKLLPNYYRQIRGTREEEDATKPKPRSFVLFSKLRLTIKINSYLTILATFGALFPPLAIIACLTIFIITYFEELSIGWLLAETRARKYFWVEEQLNHEAENVEKSSHFTLWSTLTVSSFFYGYIVFDTMGDRAGWRAALPMALLLFAFPLLLYVFMTCFNKCRVVDCTAMCRSENPNSSNDSKLPNLVREHANAGGRSSEIELGHMLNLKEKEDNNVVTMVTNPIYHAERQEELNK
jgi:Leucine-rich repeat (LRR) protein